MSQFEAKAHHLFINYFFDLASVLCENKPYPTLCDGFWVYRGSAALYVSPITSTVKLILFFKCFTRAHWGGGDLGRKV